MRCIPPCFGGGVLNRYTSAGGFRRAPGLPTKIAAGFLASESVGDRQRQSYKKIQEQIRVASGGGCVSDAVATRVREQLATDGGGKDLFNSEEMDFT